jgi:hypothetical protein
MKTNFLVIFFIIGIGNLLKSQTLYDNFEGTKYVCYPSSTPTLDTAAKNPKPNPVNSSATCAKYTRNPEKKFDNIKICVPSKLSDVSAYSTHTGMPMKLKMKIYTSAPPGTLIEILLGSRGRNNEFPEGTHSQYQAYTTKSNEWEEIEFTFSQIPKGSETSALQVDQVTLLFSPNSSNGDVYYFDEITGPELLTSGNSPEGNKK